MRYFDVIFRCFRFRLGRTSARLRGCFRDRVNAFLPPELQLLLIAFAAEFLAVFFLDTRGPPALGIWFPLGQVGRKASKISIGKASISPKALPEQKLQFVIAYSIFSEQHFRIFST